MLNTLDYEIINYERRETHENGKTTVFNTFLTEEMGLKRVVLFVLFVIVGIFGLTAGRQTKTSGVKDPFDSPEIQKLLASYRRETTLLRPRRAEKPLGFARSKMGGVPNLNGFTAWPRCDACRTGLNFVLQIYKSDFPGFYFPPGKSLFQLFRCPNPDCPAAYSER